MTGWGLIAAGRPGPRVVDLGTLRPGTSDALPDRLLVLFRGLRDLLETHRPDLVSVETAFYHKSARSTLVLGQVRGALIVCAREAGAEVEEYSPREIKLAVTGRGGAAKEQVQFMVRAMLGLRENPPLDAADALGAALCAWQRRTRSHLAVARAGAVSPRPASSRGPAR